MDGFMVNAAFPTPAILLRRFVVAGWGVSWGVLIATAITCALIQVRAASSEHPHPDLLASDYLSRYDGVFWQERYEHTWYALACVLGALGGWIATRFLRPRMAALPAVIAFVPVAAWVCRGIFKADVNLDRFLAAAAILAVPLYRRTAHPDPKCRSGHSGHRHSGLGHGGSVAECGYAAGILCVPLAALIYGVARAASRRNGGERVQLRTPRRVLHRRPRALLPCARCRPRPRLRVTLRDRARLRLLACDGNVAVYRRPSNATSCSFWPSASCTSSPRSWCSPTGFAASGLRSRLRCSLLFLTCEGLGV